MQITEVPSDKRGEYLRCSFRNKYVEMCIGIKKSYFRVIILTTEFSLSIMYPGLKRSLFDLVEYEGVCLTFTSKRMWVWVDL